MGLCMSIDEDTLQIACGAEAVSRHRSKRKLIMEMLGAEANVYRLVCKMPGRLCSNGATPSTSLFTKQGRKGVNQDSILVWEDFAGQPDTVFCGVFDGHGPKGHVIARNVRDSLPVLLALPVPSLLEAHICHPECNRDTILNKKEELSEIFADLDGVLKGWKEKFVTAYKLMDRNLRTHPRLSCYDSGTTAITMIVQGNDLVIASVGDSRAILTRREADGSLVAKQLTVDMKPDLPGELERIRSCNGRIFALEYEPGIARLWMPLADSPGLAMSRALGDACLKEYGLSEVPEVSHRRLVEGDEFVVLATDGVWDVLSNEDVARIVASTIPREDAAKVLVQSAVKVWKRSNAGWRMDDCSAVCYFLKDRLAFSSSSQSFAVKGLL